MTEEFKRKLISGLSEALGRGPHGLTTVPGVDPGWVVVPIEDVSLLTQAVTTLPARDRVVDALQAAVPILIAAAQPEEHYGHPICDDPREFHPDPECSTEEERAAHQAHCDAWDRGENPPMPPNCTCFELPTGDRVRVNHQNFGLGTTVIRNRPADEALGAAQAALGLDLPPEPGEAKVTDSGLLRTLLQELLGRHPVPWTVESDWTYEISDASGTLVAKVALAREAEALVRMAADIQAKGDAFMRDFEADLARRAPTRFIHDDPVDAFGDPPEDEAPSPEAALIVQQAHEQHPVRWSAPTVRLIDDDGTTTRVTIHQCVGDPEDFDAVVLHDIVYVRNMSKAGDIFEQVAAYHASGDEVPRG